MEVLETEFPGVRLIKPDIFSDNRGCFHESFNLDKYHSFGINYNFIQDNHSFSPKRGTIRGLHYQSEPMAQTKLIRVVSGEILDIAVDVRKGSPFFGRYIEFRLSGDNCHQVLIPAGFAHGFCTLTPDCHLLYKVDQHYSAEHNCGILWNDPVININWPTDSPTISIQDKNWPALNSADRLP